MNIIEFLRARLAEERAKARQMTTSVWPEHVRVVPRETGALDEGEPEGNVGVAGSLPNAWTHICQDGTVADDWRMHSTAFEVWSVECGQRRLAELGATLELVDQYERVQNQQARNQRHMAELNADIDRQEETGDWTGPGLPDVRRRAILREADYLGAMRPVLDSLVRHAAAAYADHPDVHLISETSEPACSPDAMWVEHDGEDRMPVTVLLVYGDQAELTTPERDHTNPVRVPAARIARDTGIPVGELSGRHLTAVLGAGGEPERFERA